LLAERLNAFELEKTLLRKASTKAGCFDTRFAVEGRKLRCVSVFDSVSENLSVVSGFTADWGRLAREDREVWHVSFSGFLAERAE
jgi:hypothetical protein